MMMYYDVLLFICIQRVLKKVKVHHIMLVANSRCGLPVLAQDNHGHFIDMSHLPSNDRSTM